MGWISIVQDNLDAVIDHAHWCLARTIKWGTEYEGSGVLGGDRGVGVCMLLQGL
jgi:hypothetical protein